jgi:hypothetical protein
MLEVDFEFAVVVKRLKLGYAEDLHRPIAFDSLANDFSSMKRLC